MRILLFQCHHAHNTHWPKPAPALSPKWYTCQYILSTDYFRKRSQGNTSFNFRALINPQQPFDVLVPFWYMQSQKETLPLTVDSAMQETVQPFQIKPQEREGEKRKACFDVVFPAHPICFWMQTGCCVQSLLIKMSSFTVHPLSPNILCKPPNTPFKLQFCRSLSGLAASWVYWLMLYILTSLIQYSVR